MSIGASKTWRETNHFSQLYLCLTLRWSQRKCNWSTGHCPCVQTAKGCQYLEFLRTMSSFLMDLQNDCCRQEPLLPFQVTLSLPIFSRKSFQVLRNYAKQSSYQTQPELLCQIDKPYYLWTRVHESSYWTWSDLVF